jgi:hypothetical protein
MTTISDRLRRWSHNLDLNQFLRVDCQQAADELERLQAIVDRLPKTADGVPITPGMVLYDSLDVRFNNPWTVTGFKVDRNGNLACVFGQNGSFDAICSGYYSTRESAEKARQP